MLIKYKEIDKRIVGLNLAIATFYFVWWFEADHVGNLWLYLMLLVGEIYHLLMAVTFWFTVAKKKQLPIKRDEVDRSVDIFITVCGEPVDIVEKTVKGAKNIDYENKKIYILNDGRVANKENWKEIEDMAQREEINCITRTVKGGAKAGNVNNGLKNSSGELVVILDADMVPEKDFLTETVAYFGDEKLGFVQTPQYYKNKETNYVTGGSWEQQELFFGPIMRGKGKHNAAFLCGTNFVARRKMFEEVGGFVEDNIAEDFVTSLKIHRSGWRSIYLNKVYCKGLAPEDMMAYYKQQLRWARGSLEILFRSNPLFISGLTWGQRIEYLSSALYYLNGTIVVIDMIMPLIFLFTGATAVNATSTSFSIFFIPFMLVNLITLYLATKRRMSFRAMAFSQSSFVIQLEALILILTGKKIGFAVTPKKQEEGNYWQLAIVHIIYIILIIVGSGWRVYLQGWEPSVVTNIAWAGFNAMMFWPYISACVNWSSLGRGWRYKRIEAEEVVKV